MAIRRKKNLKVEYCKYCHCVIAPYDPHRRKSDDGGVFHDYCVRLYAPTIVKQEVPALLRPLDELRSSKLRKWRYQVEKRIQQLEKPSEVRIFIQAVAIQLFEYKARISQFLRTSRKKAARVLYDIINALDRLHRKLFNEPIPLFLK